MVQQTVEHGGGEAYGETVDSAEGLSGTRHRGKHGMHRIEPAAVDAAQFDVLAGDRGDERRNRRHAAPRRHGPAPRPRPRCGADHGRGACEGIRDHCPDARRTGQGSEDDAPVGRHAFPANQGKTRIQLSDVVDRVRAAGKTESTDEFSDLPMAISSG